MTAKTNLATPTFNSVSWDVPLNANFTTLNNALGGVLAVSIASGDVTLTGTQAESAAIILSGALGANRTLYIPNGTSGTWAIINATSGGYGLFVSNVSGSSYIQVGQGCSAMVVSDGTATYKLNDGGANSPGTIFPFGGTVAPAGSFWCDGSVKSQASYPFLYAAIGATWNTGGEGAGNFRLPDSQGIFFRGSGAGRNPSTRTVGSYEADGLGAHTHTITDPGHSHTLISYSASGLQSGGGNVPVSINNNTTFPTSTATTGITVNASTGVETVPKNLAALYCIKY